MFGIDNKMENDQKMNVLFYNMGAMDTEVTIARYSVFNISEKKSAPYIELLAEASDKELGTMDLQLKLINILVEKFDALKEREGKLSVKSNVRATMRLSKESVKIMEILSANK